MSTSTPATIWAVLTASDDPKVKAAVKALRAEHGDEAPDAAWKIKEDAEASGAATWIEAYAAQAKPKK